MPADRLPAIRARLAALPPDLRAKVQHLHRGQLVTVTDGAESVVVLADTYCGAVHGHGGPIAEALAGLPGDAAWLAGEVERLRAELAAERGEAGPSGWTPAHAGMIRGWRRELGGSRRLNASPLPGCGWRWEYLTLGVIDAFGPDSRRPAVHATGEAPTALSAMLAADAALEVGRE